MARFKTKHCLTFKAVFTGIHKVPSYIIVHMWRQET